VPLSRKLFGRRRGGAGIVLCGILIHNRKDIEARSFSELKN